MSARFEITATPLAGLTVIRRRPLGDARGYFERVFCDSELADYFPDGRIAQINRTLTRLSGTVRGLHYQLPPQAEVKLISCLRGRVFDIAVDLRRDSPTFLRWHAEILSADNHCSLLVPAGFAHGFQTLENDCELLYLHSAPHAPAAERGLHALDPRVGIAWPQPPVGLSERDATRPLLSSDFDGVVA
ncbi:dTDP-4-dehydrorhamnose 3,5-epimerase family protein [Tahibacter caeni]|uniref:dTDP-4-dehydrorhamnose 3,5-epimerase family protein n=1 Tax=Tahibacter caeni TaxID=1453545 RepID=UPI002148E964